MLPAMAWNYITRSLISIFPPLSGRGHNAAGYGLELYHPLTNLYIPSPPFQAEGTMLPAMAWSYITRSLLSIFPSPFRGKGHHGYLRGEGT